VGIAFPKLFPYVIIPPRAAQGNKYINAIIETICKGNVMNDIIKSVESPINPEIPQLDPGDTVSVFLRIKEGANERTQEIRGTVIRMRSSGNNANFTVRRIASNGIGVERTFLLRSPRIEKVVVHRKSHVRRANLYFLRDRTGKSARLRQKFS